MIGRLFGEQRFCSKQHRELDRKTAQDLMLEALAYSQACIFRAEQQRVVDDAVAVPDNVPEEVVPAAGWEDSPLRSLGDATIPGLVKQGLCEPFRQHWEIPPRMGGGKSEPRPAKPGPGQLVFEALSSTAGAVLS
jgi:hypothetical protein